MLTVVVYQVAWVDGVPLVVTVGPVVGFDMEVQSFVRGVGDNIALIFPAVVLAGFEFSNRPMKARSPQEFAPSKVPGHTME